jgi:hypothetical protein
MVCRYGAAEVQKALKRQTARRPGPVPMKEPGLREIFLEDARVWLGGRDPFKLRSNKSIARELSAKRGGYDRDATYDRIMRKLRECRHYLTMVEAVWLSETEYSYSDNLRAMNAARGFAKKRDPWDRLLRFGERSLADYRSKFGAPPASMTMEELLAEAARPIVPTRGPDNILQILMGARPR